MSVTRHRRGRLQQARDGSGIQAAKFTPAQVGRQVDRTVSLAAQFADLESFVLEQSPHFPIAAFVQRDSKPAVTAFGGFDLDAIEAGRSVFELTPRRNRSRTASDGVPRSRTRYSRSISLEGCMRRCASSPSLVNSRRPEVLTSSRPTTIQRPLPGGGSRSKTVGRPSGSLRVVTSPRGL